MHGTYAIQLTASEIVPAEDRAAWLEKHGVPTPVVVGLTAPLATWEAAGVQLDHTGSPLVKSYGTLATTMHRAAIELARTGAKSEYDLRLDVTEILIAESERIENERLESERIEAEKQAAYMAAPLDSLLTEMGSPADSPWQQRVTAALNGADDDRGDQLRAVSYARSVEYRAGREAESKAIDTAMRAWIATAPNLPPELVRASAEGRRVATALRDILERRVTERLALCSTGSLCRTYDSEPVDRVPTAKAYEIRDDLVSSVDDIAGVLPPGAVVTIGDFERFDISSGDPIWSGGVDVTVTHPWWGDWDFGSVVLTEEP